MASDKAVETVPFSIETKVVQIRDLVLEIDPIDYGEQMQRIEDKLDLLQAKTEVILELLSLWETQGQIHA